MATQVIDIISSALKTAGIDPHQEVSAVIAATTPSVAPATSGATLLANTLGDERGSYHFDGTFMWTPEQRAAKLAIYDFVKGENEFRNIDPDALKYLVVSGRMILAGPLSVSAYAHQWDGKSMQTLYDEQAEIIHGGGGPSGRNASFTGTEGV